MKNIGLLAIGLLTISLLVIISCSKNELTDESNSKKQEIKMSEEDISFQNNLVQFMSKVNYIRENPAYKSGELIDANESIQYMETLFNATYSFNEEQYGKTKTDKTTIQIMVNNSDEVLLDDVVDTFEEIIDIVTAYYYACDFTQKGFLLLDLQRGETTDNQVDILLRSVIGEKDSDWNPFGPNDNWWYGHKKGDCEWIIGNGDVDAATKIQDALMAYKPLVSPPPGYRFVYDNYEVIELFGHEYSNDMGEKLIFYKDNETGIFTWNEKCLDPDEMNFHFYGEREVIYNILPIVLNKPINWSFMECFLEGKEEENPSLGYIHCIHHNNNLTYALLHLVEIGVIRPPINLD